MAPRALRWAVLLVLGLAAPLSYALEYKSLAAPAVAYDAPSDKARALFIVARSTPLEVVVWLDRWAKVRDAAGELMWIERRVLSDKRMLMVRGPQAEVREQPQEGAPLVFEAAKDVVLEWLEAGPPGWLKVRHAEGQSGFVRIGQVWGW
jgi:SH3-like domain-containing protein